MNTTADETVPAHAARRSRGVLARASRNPFPGLRPFREDEQHLFFGRESRVDAMVDKLAESRLLAVIGSSGCGKSSLVNGGLRLALRGGLMASAGTAWRIASMRPGGEPVPALARALAADGVLFRDFHADGLALEEIIETNLRMSRLGLVDVCAQARLPEGTNLLVIVDQFEELFRYRDSGAGTGAGAGAEGAADDTDALDDHDIDDTASAFVNLLLEAARQRTHPIHVVLTMRSDFLGDCARLHGLAEAINEGQYLVPRMSRDERRLAITGPIAVAGERIDAVLLTRLLNDLGNDPDRLPILQHALNRIWAAWQAAGGHGSLGLEHYRAVGRLSRALDRHLEQAFAELGDTHRQQVAAKLFRALTDKSTDTRGVRRPTAFGVLCTLCEATPEELGSIIDVFRAPGRSFLMPPIDEALVAETIVDISHESLMRRWHRLDAWADEEALSTRTYRRLADTAALHARGEAGLWRDPDLELALAWRRRDAPNAAWAARYGAGFEQAMAFLEASGEAREAERGKRRAERLREQELARTRAVADEQAARIEAQERAAKTQRTVTRVVSVALAVALALASLVGWQTWSLMEAERERVAAETAEREASEAARAAAARAETARAQAEAAELAEREAEAAAAAAAAEAAQAESRSERARAARKLAVTRLIDERRQSNANAMRADTVVEVINENTTKTRLLWQLVQRNDAEDAAEPFTVEFVNTHTSAVRLLTWAEGVIEIPQGELRPDERLRLELGRNDVWIARAIDNTNDLVAAGTVARATTVPIVQVVPATQ